MRPTISYTIWMSQRTGSTLLCKALESTGVAGSPNEWLHEYTDYDLYRKYGVDTPDELQSTLWDLGTSANGVFGVKVSMSEPHHSKMIEMFKEFAGCQPGDTRPQIWENAFPNHRHIYMTRRDKVRLAVSWWKAIKSNEWHRKTGEPPGEADVRGDYVYEAINTLFNEATLREVAMQRFFDEGAIVPRTVVYEDFILHFEDTVLGIIDWLGVSTSGMSIDPPFYEQLSDEVSEEWVERFYTERYERLGKG